MIFKGIPYFAYMMSTMSDFINHQLIHLRTKLQEKLKTPVPDWFIPLGLISIDQSEYRVLEKLIMIGISMKVYISVGTISLIVIPTIVFVQMEKWTTLESVYFGKFVLNGQKF